MIRGVVSLIFCCLVLFNTGAIAAPQTNLEGGTSAGKAQQTERSGPPEGIADGNYAKGTFYDPTGILIGFNLDSFCAAFERYGGDSWETICLMLYKCITNSFDCELVDCLKSFGSSDEEQSAFEACKVLCSIKPNIELDIPGMGTIKPCQAERCICESKCDMDKSPPPCDKDGFVPGVKCEAPPLLINPPSPVCCEVLLSPVIITNEDGGQVDKFGSPPYDPEASAGDRITNVGTTKSQVVEICTKGAGILNCILAIEDNPWDFPPDGTGYIGTEVINDCCNPDVRDTIDGLISRLGLGENWLSTMCGWADVANCAIAGLNMGEDITFDNIGTFIADFENALNNLSDQNSGFATYCCKRINSIQKASPAIGNILEPACTLINALGCATAILQVTGNDSGGTQTCQCLDNGDPPQANGFCDPANVNVDMLAPGVPLVTGIDCPDENPFCMQCPEENAASVWDHVTSLDLGLAMNQLTQGNTLGYVTEACCSETVQKAINEVTTDGAKFTKQICAGYEVSQCLNAFVVDLGMSNVGDQCTCSDSNSICDPVDNLSNGSNSACGANETCTDCAGIPIISFLADLTALEADGTLQDAISNNAASNIQEECCSSDEGIINTANQIDPEFGQILSKTCAAFNLQACSASIMYYVNDLQPSSSQGSGQGDNSSTLDTLLNLFVNAYDLVIDTMENATGEGLAAVDQYCCENPDTISAAQTLSKDFAKGLNKVCQVIETASCVNAMAEYTLQTIPNDLYETLSALASPASLAQLSSVPPTSKMQTACCGISVTNNQQKPANNMVPAIKALNPTVGNALEGVCHFAYAHKCAVAFNNSFAITPPEQNYETCTKGLLEGGGEQVLIDPNDVMINYCNSDDDCPDFTILQCSPPPPNSQNYNPENACMESVVEAGECGENEDTNLIKYIASVFDIGSPLHQQVLDHGLLPQEFDQWCCWDKSYEAFNYFNGLFTDGSGNPAGDVLELACAADSLAQCAAQLANTVTTINDDLLTGGDVEDGWFDDVENTLGTLTSQEDKNSIKQACCAGSGVIPAADALFGEPNDVSKIMQLTCDVIDILECATASINILSEPWQNKDELEGTLAQASGGVGSPVLDFIDELTHTNLKALSNQCCSADTQPSFERVMGDSAPLMSGYQSFCKVLDWGYCLFGVADGIGYGFTTTKHVVTNWGSGTSEGDGFLSAIQNHIANVGSLVNTIPEVMDQCCNVVPALTDPDFFINDVMTITCNDGQECTPDVYHPYMCALAYTSQRSSPSAKFQVADCCQYINWIPGITCTEPDLDSQCYDLIPNTSYSSDPRGTACMWGIKSDQRDTMPCSMKTTIDFLSPIMSNGNPLQGSSGADDFVNSVNTLYCGSCQLPPGDANDPSWWQQLKATIAAGAECLGHGCGPNVDPDVKCQGCKATDLAAFRNSGVTPPGLRCDPAEDLDGNPAPNSDQCVPISWSYECEQCEWSLDKTDTQIIQAYNNQTATQYCSFSLMHCVSIADNIAPNGTNLTLP